MQNRIASIDIFRGITVAAMILVNNPGSWSDVYAPLLHAPWHGLTPTDLIFPFFLFIVGISISLAYKNKKSNAKTYKKIIVRALKLIGLGLFLSAFLPYAPFVKDFEAIRFPGVLQRIGIVFLVSAVLYLNVTRKMLLLITGFLVIGYWLFMSFVPLPDGTMPTLERAPNNWANYIDWYVLGSHMWKADYDPEGILSTFPAIATCLIGILIGQKIVQESQEKLKDLLLISGLLLAIGYLWSFVFPLNKALWTSSFVLVTAGWATLFLVLLHYITDVKKIPLGNVFTAMGMNAITVFFLSGFIAKTFYLVKINGISIHTLLYNNLFTYSWLPNKLSSLLYAIAVVAFYGALAYVLYKKRIFIKV